MMKRIATLSILVTLMMGQSHGQDSVESRARLSVLQGVYIDVEPMSPEMEERGMTADVFEAEVERGLREAGIPILVPDADGLMDPLQPVLYVGITALLEEGVEQCVYAIRIELMQSVKLERSELSTPFHAATWSTGGVGFYRAGWRQALVDDVAAYVEVFSEAYVVSNPGPGHPSE